MSENLLNDLEACPFNTKETILDDPLDIEKSFSVQKEARQVIRHLEVEKSYHQAQIIKRIMDRYLGTRERQAIQFTILENMAQREAAERLGVSRRAIRIYQARGIKKIQKIVQQFYQKDFIKIGHYFDLLEQKYPETAADYAGGDFCHVNKLPKPKPELSD